MNTLLIAVDATKDSRAVLTTFYNLVQLPKEVILLHVQRLEGKTLMIDMLGEAEMSTLRDSLRGTEHKENLDREADRVLTYFKKEFEDSGFTRVRTVVRDGQPVDEILKVAAEENAELIMLGCTEKKGLNRLLTGSVVKDIQKHAKIPVLFARRPLMCEEPYTWRDAYYAVSFFTVLVLALFFLGKIVENGGTFLP